MYCVRVCVRVCVPKVRSNWSHQVKLVKYRKCYLKKWRISLVRPGRNWLANRSSRYLSAGVGRNNGPPHNSVLASTPWFIHKSSHKYVIFCYSEAWHDPITYLIHLIMSSSCVLDYRSLSGHTYYIFLTPLSPFHKSKPFIALTSYISLTLFRIPDLCICCTVIRFHHISTPQESNYTIPHFIRF